MLNLDAKAVGNMTGWELLKVVGIVRNGSWQDHSSADFMTSGKRTWNVYTTTARGKQHGTYIHLWTEIVRRVVLPDGTDTGSRVKDYLHLRGKVGQRIRELEEVR